MVKQELIQRRLEQNLWEYPESGCWLWVGNVEKNYVFNCQEFVIPLHHLMYELFNKRNGGYIVRQCDNPYCCNPDHLVEQEVLKGKSKPARSEHKLFLVRNLEFIVSKLKNRLEETCSTKVDKELVNSSKQEIRNKLESLRLNKPTGTSAIWEWMEEIEALEAELG